jgi:two-component system chemotaxis response regulator CheY
MSAKRLLIVDDSGFARRLLRRILEDGGYDVEEAAGGDEALAKYDATKPDAVLLDIVMGEVSGLEVLQKLRRKDPKAIVIMATADIQEATRTEALAAGAAGFVNKPFKPEEVVSATASALGGGVV